MNILWIKILLEQSDEIIVLKTNYATNLETHRPIGAKMKELVLNFENNFELDLDQLKNLVSPSTKLISLTYPHNPTGKMLSIDGLKDIIRLVEEKGIYLLMDETYWEFKPGVFNLCRTRALV